MSRLSSAALTLALSFFVAVAVDVFPASADSDTTPPRLITLSVSPSQLDTSERVRIVTVTVVATDELSGLCIPADGCAAGYMSLRSPSSEQSAVPTPFQRSSSNTYTSTLTFAPHSEEGVWISWAIYLVDNAGNELYLEEGELLARGINVAVGVGGFAPSYSRTIGFQINTIRALGKVRGDAGATCEGWVPVLLERQTSSGWQRVWRTYTRENGGFSIKRDFKPGKYRATALELGIGSPTMTTCKRVSARKDVSLARHSGESPIESAGNPRDSEKQRETTETVD